MALIQFYHLLSTPLERALPKLMEKALAAGLRGVVVADSEESLRQMDEALWSADAASFLPHGTAKDDAPQRQPIYLSLTEENPNAANMLVLTGGSLPEDAGAYERVLDVFDGHDPQALQAARERWKTYKETEHELQYIQQQKDGSWKRQA